MGICLEPRSLHSFSYIIHNHNTLHKTYFVRFIVLIYIFFTLVLLNKYKSSEFKNCPKLCKSRNSDPESENENVIFPRILFSPGTEWIFHSLLYRYLDKILLNIFHSKVRRLFYSNFSNIHIAHPYIITSRGVPIGYTPVYAVYFQDF